MKKKGKRARERMRKREGDLSVRGSIRREQPEDVNIHRRIVINLNQLNRLDPSLLWRRTQRDYE